MPDIDLTFLKDDDALTAASLQAPSTSIEAGINGVMTYGLREGALGAAHVGTLVVETGITDPVGDATLYVQTSTSQAYNAGPAYASFGADGAVDRTPIVLNAAGPPPEDWLKLDLPSVSVGMTAGDSVAGLLVLMNVEWETYVQSGAPTGSPYRLMTCIQIKVATSPVTSAWFTIDRTERFMEPRVVPVAAWAAPTDTVVRQDIPTRCLIVPADLAVVSPPVLPGEPILGVRGMVSLYYPTGGFTLGDIVELGSCQMTVIPLHAEVV